jgi:hypothetical protein
LLYLAKIFIIVINITTTLSSKLLSSNKLTQETVELDLKMLDVIIWESKCEDSKATSLHFWQQSDTTSRDR